MDVCGSGLYFKPISHIYVEKKALCYKTAQDIIAKFPYSQIVEIEHYKDFFSRGGQNISAQKNSQKLILAVREKSFIYRGAKPCHDFGNDNFYYSSTMINCIYACEYCYLQGMYPSANIVVFVNIEDCFNEVDDMLIRQNCYICVSYDTDIMAIEGIAGYGRKWLLYASKRPGLTIELRTKSANFSLISDINPTENIILAVTLSPDYIIGLFEKKTPTLENRLKSIKAVMDKGFNVRLCFDPLIRIPDFNHVYGDFFEKVFDFLNGEDIFDISIGTFRLGADCLKTMKKANQASVISLYPYEIKDKMAGYGAQLTKTMTDFAYSEISKYVKNERIFISR